MREWNKDKIKNIEEDKEKLEETKEELTIPEESKIKQKNIERKMKKIREKITRTEKEKIKIDVTGENKITRETPKTLERTVKPEINEMRRIEEIESQEEEDTMMKMIDELENWK